MNKSYPTIRDVASHLGLSISTVSFVINDKANQQRISAHTIARVKNYIEEIGYVPDHCAQSFRTKRTGIIGLLVEDLADLPTITFAKQLEHIAFKEGFKVIIQQLNEKEKVVKIVNSLYDNQIEAYLILFSNKLSAESLTRIKAAPMPIIFFSLGSTKARNPAINQVIIHEVRPDKVKHLFIELKSCLAKKMI